MDRGIEQPLAPTLGALTVTRILLDVGDQALVPFDVRPSRVILLDVMVV